MKKFLNNIRDIAVAGFMALLPVYVLILIVEKAWKALHTVGAGIAGILGVQPTLGVKGNTMFTALLVIAAFWIVCGLLVRYTFMGAMSRVAEEAISKYISDYAKYKSIAEEKPLHKVKVLDYTSALIRGRNTGDRRMSSNRTRMGTVWCSLPIHRKPTKECFACQQRSR
jgi:hypothetical protein